MSTRGYERRPSGFRTRGGVWGRRSGVMVNQMEWRSGVRKMGMGSGVVRKEKV